MKLMNGFPDRYRINIEIAPQDVYRLATRLEASIEGGAHGEKNRSKLGRIGFGRFFTSLNSRNQKCKHIHALHSLWRCRESNPGPSVLKQGFYGRSVTIAFSVPMFLHTFHRQTQLQNCSPSSSATPMK